MTKTIGKEKGITLITLIVTVLLLIIVTGTLVMKSHTSLQLSNLTRLQNDIEALNSRIASYYVKNGRLPIYEDDVKTKSELANVLNDMSINDGDTYYTIDIEELENISLNYGKAYQSTSATDKYIINEETHLVYYLKGIYYEGKEYHTIENNQSMIRENGV